MSRRRRIWNDGEDAAESVARAIVWLLWSALAALVIPLTVAGIFQLLYPYISALLG